MFNGEISRCHHPYEGLTINAQGYLIHCCETVELPIVHVDEVSDLTDTFNNHPSFIEYRNSLPDPCQRCYDKERKGITTAKHSNPLSSVWNGKIRYLEYTMSNLCNATCSMCDGFFSSSWAGKVTRLSDDAYNKIVHILPSVEKLVIKGGEPFADSRNIKILERYLEVSDGTVDIITNGSLFHNSCLSSRVHLGVSIDGTYELYRWIRSTDWDTVIDNMKRFYDATGHGVTVQSVISLYNFFNIEDYLEYFRDKEYVSRIEMNHWVDWPKHSSVQCLPEDILMEQKEKNVRIMKKYKDNPKYNLLDMTSLKYKNKKGCNREVFLERVSHVNSLRGFDLLDHVPELKNWT